MDVSKDRNLVYSKDEFQKIVENFRKKTGIDLRIVEVYGEVVLATNLERRNDGYYVIEEE